MKNNIPYVIKTNGSVTLFLKDECLTVANDHPNYNKIVEALKKGEFDIIENLVNIAKAVTQYASGQITVQNGQVFYGSFPLHNTLTNRILSMMHEGFKFDHMVKFLENLMQNPSNRAVNETYTFLENYGLPITDDGCFLAYKAVRNDYMDIYSGKLDNRVGCAPSIPRNMVDENYERDCSTGLHVGALDYVVQYGHFVKGAEINVNGNRLLIVKVNPKDVVSVPKYENHPKMRVTQYLVVSEIKDIVKELDKVVYTSNAENLDPDRTYDETSCEEESEHDESHDGDGGVGPYDEGYAVGESDTLDHRLYGYSLDTARGGDYASGYEDGYFGEEYNSPEFTKSAEDGSHDNCGDNHNCDNCSCDSDKETDASQLSNEQYFTGEYHTEDSAKDSPAEEEFRVGFSTGQRDFDHGHGFGFSLNKYYSQNFKDGYRDGYSRGEDASL
jgi:hypothetical protein